MKLSCCRPTKKSKTNLNYFIYKKCKYFRFKIQKIPNLTKMPIYIKNINIYDRRESGAFINNIKTNGLLFIFLNINK